MTHALIILATLFGSYALLLTAEYCWKLFIRAPKAIYEQKIVELEQEKAVAAGLRERTAKHPLDEHIENEVKALLRTFDDEGIKLLRWMLLKGEVQVSGSANMKVIQRAMNPMLVIERKERIPGRFLSFYRINPKYEDALKNALFLAGDSTPAVPPNPTRDR